jgi:hypothetical protein
MAKRVRLWASSWIAGPRVQAELGRARTLAMAASDGIQPGQTGAFGVAGHRPALHVGQVVAQPAWHCASAWGWAQHRL